MGGASLYIGRKLKVISNKIIPKLLDLAQGGGK